jgi:HSP20 family protein
MFKKKKKGTKKTDSEVSEEVFGTAEEHDALSLDVQTDDNDRSDNHLQALDEQPEWIDQEDEEGQLSVDVYQEGNDIIVKSTIAGIEPENVDISISNDMLTIRGERKRDKTEKGREYFFQECYWGAFSRSIILPVEIDVKNIDATIKNGILTVTLPKLEAKTKKKIKVKDEDE